MKTMKLFGLIISSAVALMALTSSASATILTSPEGTQIPVGTTFEGLNTGAVLGTNATGTVECKKSTIKGSVSNAGSATTTVGISLSALTFSECNATVTVLKTGSLEIHAGEGGNGTVTGSGQEVTTESSGFHCIFATNNTNWNLIDAPSPTEPRHNLLTVTIPFTRTGGRSGAFCGSSSLWHFTSTIQSWGIFTYISVS